VRETRTDAGFTLIEVLVTMVLMGLMMAIAVAGFSRYSNAHEHEGTARSLQSALRQAQQRAVTEGRAICVALTTSSYTVWRSSCDAATGTKLEGPRGLQASEVHLQAVTGQPLVFTPRGTATWAGITSTTTDTACGSVKAFDVLVTRDGSSKTYRLCIAALTGRVDLHG
jgi:type II secretion system protein H